ncbi:hypothetical protein NL316_27055, partial [Klebsiella pneumoniae]|nr:hypothetical protein [Klebsiella pneumoniae]
LPFSQSLIEQFKVLVSDGRKDDPAFNLSLGEEKDTIRLTVGGPNLRDKLPFGHIKVRERWRERERGRGRDGEREVRRRIRSD